MRTSLVSVLALLACICTAAEEKKSPNGETKTIAEYSSPMVHPKPKWSLRHFEELNLALNTLTAQMITMTTPNTKCVVVPNVQGYGVIWMRADWEDAPPERLKKAAEAMIESFLFGKDFQRISEAEKSPNQSLQPTAPSGRG